MRTEMLLSQLHATHAVLLRNTDEIDHAQSLRRPEFGCSSLNWMVGHLSLARARMLGLLGSDEAPAQDHFAAYARGGDPDAVDAMAFATLRDEFSAMQPMLIKSLEEIPSERLDEPAPFSPTKNPDETIGSLAATLVFHEAYHVGQTAILRRFLGLDGAVR